MTFTSLAASIYIARVGQSNKYNLGPAKLRMHAARSFDAAVAFLNEQGERFPAPTPLQALNTAVDGGPDYILDRVAK